MCIYSYMCIYIHIYEEIFHKTRSLNLALTLVTHVLEWRLLRLGKELFIYIYIYIYIYTHIYTHLSICEKLLFLNVVTKLGINIASPSWRMALNRVLEKGSSYIRMYTHMKNSVPKYNLCTYHCHGKIIFWNRG